MTTRFWIVTAVLLGGTGLLHGMSHGEAIVARQPLKGLPYLIGTWSGQEQPLEKGIDLGVSVSDYTNRNDLNSTDLPVKLNAGDSARQRTGDTIHSPKNCLPGVGWEPVKQDYATITLANGRQIKVNDYVIAQGLNKELVFYWYQGRGRVIASEYMGK